MTKEKEEKVQPTMEEIKAELKEEILKDMQEEMEKKVVEEEETKEEPEAEPEPEAEEEKEAEAEEKVEEMPVKEKAKGFYGEVSEKEELDEVIVTEGGEITFREDAYEEILENGKFDAWGDKVRWRAPKSPGEIGE